MWANFIIDWVSSSQDLRSASLASTIRNEHKENLRIVNYQQDFLGGMNKWGDKNLVFECPRGLLSLNV
jgi:hypothetical protein